MENLWKFIGRVFLKHKDVRGVCKKYFHEKHLTSDLRLGFGVTTTTVRSTARRLVNRGVYLFALQFIFSMANKLFRYEKHTLLASGQCQCVRDCGNSFIICVI